MDERWSTIEPCLGLICSYKLTGLVGKGVGNGGKRYQRPTPSKVHSKDDKVCKCVKAKLAVETS